MILSDFLSRQKNDKSNPCEVIHISFNMKNILYGRYYNIGERKEEWKYLTQARSQSKSSGITLPAVHGVDKGVNPSVKPEKKQVIKPMIVASSLKAPTQIRPTIVQSRVGLRRKVKISTSPQLNKPAHVTNKSILQKPESTIQQQTSLESGPQTKYIPVPQTRSENSQNPN